MKKVALDKKDYQPEDEHEEAQDEEDALGSQRSQFSSIPSQNWIKNKTRKHP